MDLNTKRKKIFIPLLNEGVPVARPTQGIEIADNTYQVLATADYDPEDEEWMFPPGSIVKCVKKHEKSEIRYVAYELVQ